MRTNPPTGTQLKCLSMDDVKEILRDPWHALVVEPLTGEVFITTYGSTVIEIVEGVRLEAGVSEWLENLSEEDCIYYGSFDEISPAIINPHIFDVWREDVYGEQSISAALKAKELGLAG